MCGCGNSRWESECIAWNSLPSFFLHLFAWCMWFFVFISCFTYLDLDLVGFLLLQFPPFEFLGLGSRSNYKLWNEAQTIVICFKLYFTYSDNVGSQMHRLVTKVVIVPDVNKKCVWTFYFHGWSKNKTNQVERMWTMHYVLLDSDLWWKGQLHMHWSL